MTAGRKSAVQFLKFSVTGVLNTAVDYLVFWLFLNGLGVDKSISQIIATALAMPCGFIINRLWTFGKHDRVKVSEIVKYVAVNLCALGVNLLLLNFFYHIVHLYVPVNALLSHLGAGFRLEGDTAILLCKIAATPFELLVNFIGNKLFVFHR